MNKDFNYNRISLRDFKDSGLFFYINTVLQPFGICLVMEKDEGTNHYTRLYPAITPFIGFTEEGTARNIRNMRAYMENNGSELLYNANDNIKELNIPIQKLGTPLDWTE